MTNNMVATILMTACVIPNTDDPLAISDIEIRKAQYTSALKYYWEKTNFDIVFCENSGTDIRDSLHIQNIYCSDRLEYISYTSPPCVPDRGKGYKEMEIIEHAFKHSKKLSHSNVVVKVTGRLILKNIKAIVDYYIHLGGVFVGAWMGIKTFASDSRYIIASPNFYRFFITYKDEISKKSVFEVNLCKAISEWKKKYKFIYPNHYPNTIGIGGGQW